MTTKIDLTPAILDLVLYAGDGEDFQITFKDSIDVIDVSMYTWEAQIRELRTSIDSFVVTIDMTKAVTGVLVLHVSELVTKILPRVSYWDLQCVSPTSPAKTVLQGTVTTRHDVTRP